MLQMVRLKMTKYIEKKTEQVYFSIWDTTHKTDQVSAISCFTFDDFELICLYFHCFWSSLSIEKMVVKPNRMSVAVIAVMDGSPNDKI